MHLLEEESTTSFWHILYGVLNDWAPHAPLMIISIILLILFPIFLKSRRNAFILLTIIVFPMVVVYLFCKLSNFSHFVTSRYFINFLPLFFITLFLSLDAIETKFNKLGINILCQRKHKEISQKKLPKNEKNVILPDNRTPCFLFVKQRPCSTNNRFSK